MKGLIKKEFKVDCGICLTTEDLFSQTMSECKNEARDLDWSLTKLNGWVCPDCK